MASSARTTSAATSASSSSSSSGSSSGAATISAATLHGVKERDYFVADTRPVILFDGVCNLCNGAVNFMLDWDTKGAFRMAALQSPAGRALLVRSGRAPDDLSSIVLVTSDQSYIRSEAILRIASGLSMPLSVMAMLGFPVPLLMRDAIYDLVANNRYNILGKRNQCRLSDPRAIDRFLVD